MSAVRNSRGVEQTPFRCPRCRAAVPYEQPCLTCQRSLLAVEDPQAEQRSWPLDDQTLAATLAAALGVARQASSAPWEELAHPSAQVREKLSRPGVGILHGMSTMPKSALGKKKRRWFRVAASDSTAAESGERDDKGPLLASPEPAPDGQIELDAFRRGLTIHDQANPEHPAHGIGLAPFDMRRLSLHEGARVERGVTIHADNGAIGSFRVLCDCHPTTAGPDP